MFNVHFNGLENVVKVMAHGPFTFGSRPCYALVTELPQRTVADEIESLVKGRDSVLMRKYEVRKIAKDVMRGVEQMHNNVPKVLHSTYVPSGIYLFEKSGSKSSAAKITAKLADFRSSHAVEDKKELSKDTERFGAHFLDKIVGGLYFAAKKRADTDTPCPPPRNTPHDWLSGVCEIVMNLDRVSLGVRIDKTKWTLKKVLDDSWLNGKVVKV